MLIKLFIISAILVGLSLLGMALTIIVKPNGRFPETHVGRNKEMRKRGITCAQHTDVGCNPITRSIGCGCSAMMEE